LDWDLGMGDCGWDWDWREGWLMVRVSVCPGCRCRSDEGWVKYVDRKRR
jgi:hypothetical protein